MIGSICDTVYESIKSLTPTQIVFIILIAVAVPAIVKLMCERNVENFNNVKGLIFSGGPSTVTTKKFESVPIE